MSLRLVHTLPHQVGAFLYAMRRFLQHLQAEADHREVVVISFRRVEELRRLFQVIRALAFQIFPHGLISHSQALPFLCL